MERNRWPNNSDIRERSDVRTQIYGGELVTIRRILFAFIMVCSHHAIAQPGPTPDPWSYGPSLSIFYNNGEIDIGTPAHAGTLGPGWFNAAGGFAVNGVALPGAFGSQSANLIYASPCGSPGTPIFRAICIGDLPANLSVVGTLSVTGQTTVGNAAINGVLSGSGVSNYLSTYLPTYLASPPCIGCTAPNAGKFLAATVTSIGINSNGMVGDGVTINNTVLASLLSGLASSGGEAALPCGVYKVSASFAVTIAAGRHITLRGAGEDCTELYFSGTTAGITFALGSQASSVTVRDMAITTDDATGVNTAITLSSNAITTGTNGGAQNFFIGVIFRGHDGYGVADYWGVGLSTITADNITIDRLGYYGAPAVVGTAIKTSSVSSAKFGSRC